MTTIHYESDVDPSAIEGSSIAVVGYGNQGRSWALNLRDSGLAVQVCVRADTTRQQAEADGFAAADLAAASAADIVCLLVPDDAIPALPLQRPAGALTIVARGYTLAFDRAHFDGDIGMIAPRMLGPEVRLCYQEGIGFITALGIHSDKTGTALARTLADQHARLDALTRDLDELTLAVAAHAGGGWRDRLRWLVRGGLPGGGR